MSQHMPPAHPFDDDKLKEECGIFGVIGTKDAANFVALGLHALQHRGQEGCGVAFENNRQLDIHKGVGLVTDVFKHDISIQTNASINDNVITNIGNLPEMLTDEHINLDQYEQAACGLEDFRALLLSWKQFTNGLH